MINMTIAELKRLISDLPDNMPVIIPVWEMRYSSISRNSKLSLTTQPTT